MTICEATEQEGFEAAIENPSRFVLKEQTEGGTQMLVDQEIPPKLEEAAKNSDLTKWVIMERIRPKEFPTYCSSKGKMMAITELGIYSAIVNTNQQVLFSKNLGYLARTKETNATSGGFATGSSCIDDIYFQ